MKIKDGLSALTPDPSPTEAGEGSSNRHGGLIPPRSLGGRGG
ncbi:hypothetical protein Hgul01_03264 [Herpetosiphon gulosus]|uniref:Uncharacterized protein n=1 Tax=Herpetosiphon gulosus TaxID=1973496 RepID=A0ABP9X230_9CHLR